MAIDEKVLIERLEEKYNEWCDIYNTKSIKGVFDEFADGMGEGLGKAIEIANQLAEEQNNGWIPCDERLPEESEYVLCSLNQDNPIIIHTIIIAQYNGETHWHNGTVLAWQPLPAPYKQKE